MVTTLHDCRRCLARSPTGLLMSVTLAARVRLTTSHRWVFFLMVGRRLPAVKRARMKEGLVATGRRRGLRRP